MIFLCYSLFSFVSTRVSGGGLELRGDFTSELARNSRSEATLAVFTHGEKKKIMMIIMVMVLKLCYFS